MQAAPVMAGLDDTRVQPQLVAVVAGHELELVDVEAELVQPVQPVVDLVPVSSPNDSSRVSSSQSDS